jgi:hypothetical protein
MNRATLLLTLGLLAVAACDSATSPTRAVPLGEPFELPVGQAASIEDELLVVSFQAVTADSRCPIGVLCIRAGEAVVSLEARRLPSTTAPLVLKTDPQSETTGRFQSYEIELVELKPHPRLGETIDPGQYVATLLVRRP